MADRTYPGTIRAIETRYAGHLFRSRLEARWAVFFDALGIKWIYEPQGFELDGVRYLPDFLLTNLEPPLSEVFVEVKGHLDESSAEKIVRLAAAERIVLLLMDIPEQGQGGPDFHLTREVPGRTPSGMAQTFNCSWDVHRHPRVRLVPIGFPYVLLHDPAKHLCDRVERQGLPRLDGRYSRPLVIEQAYDAARQARFEHGAGARQPSIMQPSVEPVPVPVPVVAPPVPVADAGPDSAPLDHRPAAKAMLALMTAEQRVLGAVLRGDLDTLPDLEPDEFYRPAHQDIYDVARDLADAGRQPTRERMVARFGGERELMRRGGWEYIALLMTRPPGDLAQDVAQVRRGLVDPTTYIGQQG